MDELDITDEELAAREKVARDLTNRLLADPYVLIHCPGCLEYALTQDEHGRGVHDPACVFRRRTPK